MPYFAEHKALFLHIPKCAGKSIENALLPAGIDADSGKRSFANLVTRPFARLTASPLPARFLLGTLDVSLAAQHLTYVEIKMLGLLKPQELEQALVFATVRDPYNRAISSVSHFRHRFADHYTIGEHPTPAEVERALEFWRDIEPEDHNVRAHRRAQTDFLLDIDGQMKANRLLRLETLTADFASLCEALGLPPSGLLHSGKGAVQAGIDALYTPRSRRLVQEMFPRDFDLLDYPA